MAYVLNDTDHFRIYRGRKEISLPFAVFKDYINGITTPFSVDTLSLPAFPLQTALDGQEQVFLLKDGKHVPYKLDVVKGLITSAPIVDQITPVLSSFPASADLTGNETFRFKQGDSGFRNITLAEMALYTGSGSAPITLNTLTFSTTLQNGVATSGFIIGATIGSTIACNIPGIIVNSGARTYAGTPYTTGAIANGTVETLAGATNNNNPSPFTVAATALPLPGSLVAAWLAEDLQAAGVGNLGTVGGANPWVDRINGIQGLTGAGVTKLKTNAEGTFPSVWFNGTYLTAGQNATLLAAINSKTYTIYAIVKNLLANGNASIICTSGTNNFFFTADGINIGSSAGTVPFLPAQGTNLFSVGMRGSFTGGGTDGRWASDNHTIINGCAANGNASPLRAATAASDVFIGGQGGAAGKMEILELYVYSVNCTHAQDIQFEKYRCDKYGKAYPWAGLSYVPVIAGDSISNGTLCDSWAVATPKIIADNLGLGFGQWILAATPAISAQSLLLKDAVTLAGLPAQIGIPTKIHQFEFVNNLQVGQNSAQTVITHQNICALYKSQGFTKVILGSTIDYGNRTNVGVNSKAAFVAGLIALPAGTYDYFTPLHADATIGVDGTAPNAGSNTYFADSISHPSGHANFPTVQSGAPYLASMMSNAFAAA
jgi:hypothetical protein